ncbi:MAG: CBS domain-containing protein [Candidatus Heimdallarchaeota archaeon]
MPTVARLKIDDEYEIVSSDSTIKDAAKIIRDKDVPDLVVLEGETIIGIISDYEITVNVVAEEKDPAETLVKDAMYAIEPIDLQTSVEQAFEILQEHNIPIIPVAQEGKLLGVVTITDCWGFLSESESEN